MKTFLLLILTAFLTLLPSAYAGDTIYYSWMMGNNPAGFLWKFSHEPGKWIYHYEYNDRGRGPNLDVDVELDQKGKPKNWIITGVNYFKVPVEERFSLRNGKAYWKNKLENDSSNEINKTYSPAEPIPTDFEIYLKTAGANGVTAILPSGNYQFINLESIVLSGETVTLYEFRGHGFFPTYHWADTGKNFFAALDDWSGTIRKGYEIYADTLREVQKKFKTELSLILAKKFTHTPAEGIVVRNIKVFDPESGMYSGLRDIKVERNRISEISASNSIDTKGYDVIDGSGKTLFPGLWEMHGHFFIEDGPFNLAFGITNYRDMGNKVELFNFRKLIGHDSLLGPEINVTAGLIDGEGEFTVRVGFTANNLEEALKYVDSVAALKYNILKIYSSIKPEWVAPMVEKAHRLGLRVCGHIPSGITAETAVKLGFDEITHLNMVFLNFLGDTIRTETPRRFRAVGERGYTVDVAGRDVSEFINLLKERRTVIDPTIGLFEGLFTEMPAQVSKSVFPIYDMLPITLKRYYKSGSYIGNESETESYRKSYLNMLKMLKLLYDNNIPMVIGTDVLILAHEMEIFSEAGIPNGDILKMATYEAARIANKLDDYGSIEKGKFANLIIVDGDPLSNMQDIRKISAVIKQGKIYNPAEILNYFGYNWK